MPRRGLRGQSAADSDSADETVVRTTISGGIPITPAPAASRAAAARRAYRVAKRRPGSGVVASARGPSSRARHVAALEEAHGAAVTEVQKIFREADTAREQRRTQTAANWRELRELVEDSEGAGRTREFLDHARDLVRLGGQVVAAYDEADSSHVNQARGQHEGFPLADRWFQDFNGLACVFEAGARQGDKLLQAMVVPPTERRAAPAAAESSETDSLAEEMLRRAAGNRGAVVADSWGKAALGHLATWVGVIKSARMMGVSLPPAGGTGPCEGGGCGER